MELLQALGKCGLEGLADLVEPRVRNGVVGGDGVGVVVVFVGRAGEGFVEEVEVRVGPTGNDGLVGYLGVRGSEPSLGRFELGYEYRGGDSDGGGYHIGRGGGGGDGGGGGREGDSGGWGKESGVGVLRRKE